MLFEKIEKKITHRLQQRGYQLNAIKETGLIYENRRESICIKIDINICEKSSYPYISYTSLQNELVHQYNKFLRFSVSSVDDLERFEDDLEIFTGYEVEADKLKHYGANRQEQEIDPTLPEATFEECFALAFGEKSLYALAREDIYYDYDGKRRFIDYVLKTSNGVFAIELNGEQFHHPAAIKEKRYQSQLFKQNSLAAQGYKVFRWSNRGMADREKFIQEIKRFFGDPALFESTPHFKSLRSLHTFQLAEHQVDSLKYLESLRAKGRNTFIIILPTATGKTEIFIEDLFQQQSGARSHKALILVPRKNLKEQTIGRFKLRHKELNIDEDFNSTKQKHICVQTYQFIHRHYHEAESDRFDYIVVDEAHHAQANGLKKIIEYFKPDNLLGFTATDERLDQKRLEDVFGEYETQMTLEEAVKRNIVPPISVFRLETNIDLSEVRYNGKDFVKSDLQKTIQIPSRDEMIVRVLKENFSQPLVSGTALKQGLIFCVDIKHAKRVAQLLNEAGIKSAAVSGTDRRQSDKALADYEEQKLQFLCACDLLNEGWDSPQTSVLVMARPTMSKVLYMQQLGRGTRHHKDKERLYVIDVVDSYGAQMQPWSAHGIFKTDKYLPFGEIFVGAGGKPGKELLVLSGLHEQIVRLIPLDVFSMQEQLAGMLNTEQLARELFVSTGTVKNWLKKGDVSADATLPFGKSTLHFFAEETVDKIRELKNLSLHTEFTRRDDFINFIEEGDYTFSYKIIFLCLMFKLANERGEVDIEELAKNYAKFYSDLLDRYGKADREKSPLNKTEILDDKNVIQKSILQNPFEKFERKRFMHHCKDLKYISFDSVLWRTLNETDKNKIQQTMNDDLERYYKDLNVTIDHKLKSNIYFIAPEIESIAESLIVDSSDKKENITYIPYYPIEIAAGGFAESNVIEEAQQWINAENLTLQHSLTKDLFVSKVSGLSMEPTIPGGSYCLFKYGVVGSRNNRVVLVKKDGIIDPDLQTSFTIKRYYSEKIESVDSEWTHQKIELRPDNPEYDTIEIKESDADSFIVVAEFIQLLEL